MRFRAVVAAALTMTLTTALIGCQGDSAQSKGAVERQVLADEHARLNPLARRYVDLNILLGHHDEWVASGFYGPAAWRSALASQRVSIPDIVKQATALQSELRTLAPFRVQEAKVRHAFLIDEAGAFAAFAQTMSGTHFSAREEARRLYSVNLTPISEAAIEAARAALDQALAGPGPLAQRYAAYRSQIMVPPARMAAVMTASSEECRRRVLARLALPYDRGMRVLVPTGMQRNPGGDLQFTGGFTGTIVAPVGERTLDYAFTTACHEGYLGHYLKGVTREHRAQSGGFPELYVWPIIAGELDEGTAELGPDLFFPPEDASRFFAEVLAPLGGIEPEAAARNGRVGAVDWGLKRMVAYEAGRRLAEGEATREQARTFMQEVGLFSPASSESWLRWSTANGTYALLYQSGYARFTREIEASAVNDDRLSAFIAIVTDPWAR